MDPQGGDDDDVSDGKTLRRMSRPMLSLIVAVIVALVVLGWIGDASVGYLVDHHPLWLIALNARNRNLVLVVNHVELVPYYVVGTLRLLLSDPLFYLLGYYYGDAGIKWMERQTPTYGKLVRSAEKWFGVAAYPLVFIAPNNYICLFAGAAGMPIPVFFLLNVTGTIARLWLIIIVGNIFDKPLDAVLRFIQDYRIPIIIASVLIVLLTIWNERRQGESGIHALTHLEEELEAGEEAE
ncbi:MAG TPA: hypothetical protein VGZ52_11395 [Acidimicrobiales bacterium]|nr:hypothetical protein [Acidimicrobiales bacterium]